MKPMTRRSFLRTSITAAAATSLAPLTTLGQNNAVRMAMVGLGGLDLIGGVGGRGRQLMATLRKIPDARIVALCDVDETVLNHGVQLFKDRGETVTAYGDIRKLLEDKTVDAVAVATPNHWHALAAIWACQAG